MSSIILAEKENAGLPDELSNKQKVGQTTNNTSILKSSQKENCEPCVSPSLSPKKNPKVSFKNTPVRHRPERYKIELPQLDTWEEIRCLDEEENWTERTQVVTKEDHQLHLETAKEFLEEIINNLPIKREENNNTDTQKANTQMEQPEQANINKSKSPARIAKPIKGGIRSPPIPKAFETEFPELRDDDNEVQNVLNSPGPLDPVIATVEAYLSAGEDDIPRQFSPIGSERTSPETANMMSSQEDLDKLLIHGDETDIGDVPPLKIHHSEPKPDSHNDKGMVNHDRIPIKAVQDSTLDTELKVNGEEKEDAEFDSLPVKPRTPKSGATASNAENGDSEFDALSVKPRSPKTITTSSEEKEDAEFDALPVTPRVPKSGVKNPVAKTGKSPDKEEKEKFKKPLPPKPWKMKKKKVQQEDDTVVIFAGADKAPPTGTPSAETPPAEHTEDTTSDKSAMMGAPSSKLKGQQSGVGATEILDDNVGGLKTESSFPDGDQDSLGLGDDDFKSAADAFSLELDYLEKFGNSSGMDKLSALARQSLYVKFDPLVGGRTASPAKEALNMKADALNSKAIPTIGGDLFLIDTPPSSKGHVSRGTANATTNSPASVDKLLTFSPSSKSSVEQAKTDDSVQKSDGKLPQSPKKTKGAADDELHLVQPLLFDKSDIEAALKKEREALLKQVHEESAIRDMEIQEISKKCQASTDENEKLRRENEELRTVMNEYERTMAEMIENGKKSQTMFDNSKSEVIKERDQLQADLNSVEAAFSDLHRRYDKLKGVVENFKKNEEILKKAARDYQEKLKKSEEKYQLLKKHAEEKIETANVEINRVRRSNDSEMAVMRAALKKEQTKVASLETSIQQKVEENKELTAICDELIQNASQRK
ncbi:transforming acidic coiled-coil-containing protein 3 isoform X2 [Nematostella vectensis]|nr:transforming acidic coiled-coil-containing protein 3 isoform X2 [Nematostella vectensis]